MDWQRELFNRLRLLLSDERLMIDTIGDILGINTDAAYRRIRGKTELTCSELFTLCGHFNFSLDEMYKNMSGNYVVFKYNPIDFFTENTYMPYYEKFAEFLANIASGSSKELIFQAKYIPFYCCANHDTWLYFKFYVWHDIVHKKRISFKEFRKMLNMSDLISCFNQIERRYMSIPSREIWTKQIPDISLQYLEYYWKLGIFEDNTQVLDILEQISDAFEKVRLFTENGYKGDQKTPISLYICPIETGGNYMLTKRDGKYNCLVRLYPINSIITNNVAFCGEMEKWLESLISKSLIVSNTAEAERHEFFQTIAKKMEKLVDKIKAG